MTKYLFLAGRIAEFRLSCLSCNIPRILRHVTGGLTRDGDFEPQFVKKNQTTLTGDIEEKIIWFVNGSQDRLKKSIQSYSRLKMLYLAMIDITKKWTGKRKDRGQIRSQLEIYTK